MPITAADVIAGTLRRAGIPDADFHAKAIAADLAGHSLLADSGTPRRGPKRNAGPAPKCQNPDAPGGPHASTALVGKHCPICGWTPNDTTTTGA